MKRLKFIPCFLLMLFLGGFARSQQSAGLSLQINRDRINTRFNSYVFNRQDFLLKECGQGCMFIRFSLDGRGNIVHPQSNEGAWQYLDTFVIAALRSTNGLWPDGNDIDSTIIRRVFLLPVWYSIGQCKPKPATGSKTMSEAEAVLATIPVFDTTVMEANAKKEAYYNFMHMTDFEKKPGMKWTNVTTLDCILLAPLSIATIKF